jgi:hypothetical protein
MLTLVLSCDVDGCDARQEIKADIYRLETCAVEAGWRWRVWAALGDWRLCCPEHAGAPRC